MTEEKKKWRREISAGGIVYKKQDNPAFASSVNAHEKASAGRRIFILLIMPKGPSFGPPVGYWTFPKGLINDHDGENMEQVAWREVKEEGGVEAEIKHELGYVKFFRASKEYGNALKFVHFWLMEYKSGDPANHDEEVAEAAWFPIEDVLSKLKFPHDKEIFLKAKQVLYEL